MSKVCALAFDVVNSLQNLQCSSSLAGSPLSKSGYALHARGRFSYILQARPPWGDCAPESVSRKGQRSPSSFLPIIWYAIIFSGEPLPTAILGSILTSTHFSWACFSIASTSPGNNSTPILPNCLEG